MEPSASEFDVSTGNDMENGSHGYPGDMKKKKPLPPPKPNNKNNNLSVNAEERIEEEG